MKAIMSIVAGLVLVAACSCQASVLGGGEKEEFHKSYALSAGGSVRLHNINGDVQIKTWDKNEVKVDAIKHADDKEMLDELKIIVDATSDLVDIDTQYPDDNEGHGGHGLWVEYTITVPKGVNLDMIKTVNGDIDISGVGGKLNVSTVNGTVRVSDIQNECRLETVNGKIHAECASLKSESDIKLKSVNGGIAVNLPANSSVDIKAKTLSGHISNDFGLVSSRDDDEHSFVKIGDSLDGKIGSGGAHLDAETVNGAIKILKSGDDK